jgi:hypothetical protein
MAYTNSRLATCIIKSPNYSKGRECINRITIHHMAGNLSVERCGQVFANKNRQASSNYGIGTDGRIGLYVDEANRSWCSSNAKNDRMAVTIEVANTTAGVTNKTWDISKKAYDSLIALCVDICRRNGFKSVMSIDSLEKGTIKQKTETANNYKAPSGVLVLTQHNYFNSTACPGPYIKNRWNNIVADINKALGGATPTPQPTPTPTPTPSPTPSGKYMYKGVDYKWVFNPTYYADKYPDLKAAFGYDGAKLFDHFTTYGMKEKRQAIATFNVEAYANNNPDLRTAYGMNWPAYYEHYCRYGHNEGRKAV